MAKANSKNAILAAGLFLLMSFLFSRCAKEHLEEPPVYFQEDIFPVIVTNCTESGCHNPVDRTEGYDFTTYEGILQAVVPGDYQASELYKALVKPFGHMPEGKPRLPDYQIVLIARWIEEGAEDTSSGGLDCNTDGTTFSGTVKPIINTWCISCHSGPFPSGNVDLSTYSGVKIRVDNGLLLGVIRHDPGFRPMPDGGAKLPPCDIKKIERWVADGALDN